MRGRPYVVAGQVHVLPSERGDGRPATARSRLMSTPEQEQSRAGQDIPPTTDSSEAS